MNKYAKLLLVSLYALSVTSSVQATVNSSNQNVIDGLYDPLGLPDSTLDYLKLLFQKGSMVIENEVPTLELANVKLIGTIGNASLSKGSFTSLEEIISPKTISRAQSVVFQHYRVKSRQPHLENIDVLYPQSMGLRLTHSQHPQLGVILGAVLNFQMGAIRKKSCDMDLSIVRRGHPIAQQEWEAGLFLGELK